MEDQASEKNTIVAVVLAMVGFVFPILGGAGQVYNGAPVRGVVFSVIQLLNAALILAAVGFVTYPIVGLYVIYDAYKGEDAPFYGVVLGDDGVVGSSNSV